MFTVVFWILFRVFATVPSLQKYVVQKKPGLIDNSRAQIEASKSRNHIPIIMDYVGLLGIVLRSRGFFRGDLKKVRLLAYDHPIIPTDYGYGPQCP